MLSRVRIRRSSRRSSRSRSGFTLLELVLVLALLAVMAGVAAPGLAAFQGGLELRSGAMRVASALLRARMGALADGAPWELRVIGPSSFEVGPEGSEPGQEILPGGVVFARVTSGGDVRFQPTGRADNATFTLARSGQEREVVVNQRGRISLRQPSVTP